MSSQFAGTAAALRLAFDQSFATAREARTETPVNLLALRVGGDPYAIRLSEVASLHADRIVVPVPSANPALLGLVGFRGSMAPVFDLRTLLGYPGAASARWLLLLRAAEPVGFAFDLFESHLLLSAESISSVEVSAGSSPFIRGLVRAADGVVRPLIHSASLIEAVTRQAPPGKALKE